MPISLDLSDAESRYRLEPAHEQTPEKVFERQWAVTLVNTVLLPAEKLCTKCLLKAGLEEVAGEGHLHVRCPHCHNPIEIVEDTPLRDITCPSCDSKFSLVGDETTLAAGQQSTTIGKFELIEQVGIGGFGTVWKAQDKELDRTVAVKVPRRDQISGTDAEQFMRHHRARRDCLGKECFGGESFVAGGECEKRGITCQRGPIGTVRSVRLQGVRVHRVLRKRCYFFVRLSHGWQGIS